MRTLALITAGAIAAAVMAAPPASAVSIRYAAPAGTGSACSQAAPCSFKTAVESAANGDTVQLAADEYHLSDAVQITADNLTIQGPAGVTSPGDFLAFLIFKDQADGGAPDTASKLLFYGQNTKLQRLAVTGRADSSASLVGSGLASGVVYDRIYASNSGDGTALFGRNATLTNSYIRQTGPGANGRAALFTGRITGSTLYSATGSALWLPNSYFLTPNCSLTIRDTLAWGGGRNLLIDQTNVGPGICSTFTVDYDYSWIPNPGGGALGGGILTHGPGGPTAGSHNLANTPAVFNPTNPDDSYLSNLVLPPGSPAINAGCTPGCSDHDYYGRSRPIGSANDIGAREQSIAPVSSGVSATSVSTTGAALSATLTPGGSPSTFALQTRPSGATTWTTLTSGTQSTDLFGSPPVSATASGLSPDTAYETRLTASNDRGAWESPVTTFRTSTSPPPTISVTGVRSKVTKRKVRLLSSVTVSRAGSITQTATTGTGSAKKTRCTITRAVPSAGTYSLTCRPSSSTRSQLRRKALTFTLATAIDATTGSARVTSRLKVIRKR